MAEVSSNMFSLEEWKGKWEEEKTDWQRKEVRDLVVKYYEQMTNKGELKRVLVPLCGKTQEMIFLYKQGHEVVGIEASYKACKEFFQDNNIKFSEEVDQISGSECILTSEDKRITLYQGDFYKITLKEHIGTFGAVLDWNSLIAIEPSQRKTYIAATTRLLRSNGKVLLNTLEYPKEEHGGPPCAITVSDVEELYKGNVKVEFLETCVEGLDGLKSKFNLSKIVAHIFLLTKH